MNEPSRAADVLPQFVERAQRLYTPPAVALKVVDLTGVAGIDVQALKRCVEQDPALTAKILRVVNSSVFGLRQGVADLGQALSLLGTKPLKLLVLGFSMPPRLLTGIAGESLAEYWRHAILKAIAAREMSERFWSRAGDEAFVAGLLQDIGMLVLIQELGEDYLAFLEKAKSQRRDLGELEAEALGFDHVVLSSRLLEHWRLPPAVCQAVGCPFDPERVEQFAPDQRPLPQILHLAELVAQLLTQGDPRFLRRLLELGQRYRKLSLESWRILLAAIEAKADDLADVFSVRLPPGVNYGDVLEQAHQRLAAVGDAAAEALLECVPIPPATIIQEKELGTRNSEREVEMAPPASVSPPPMEKQSEGASNFESLAVKPSAEQVSKPASVPQASNHAVVPAAPLLAPPVARDEADPGLLGRLALSLRTCRQKRAPVSLILVEIDRVGELLLALGSERWRRLRTIVERSVTELGNPQGAWQVRDGRFGCVIEACDRNEAADQAKRLLRALRQWGERNGLSNGLAPSMSAGVAGLSLPPRDFPPHSLLEAAERCLYAAQSAGGDGVRSIELP